VAGLRIDLGKSHARRRIGDADQMLAARTLNLPAGILGFAFQRLITVGTVEFEFVRAHGLCWNKGNLPAESMSKSRP
jgi:hypothetical protein